MRLAELATVSNFERLKPPYVGVTADSEIRLFFAFFSLPLTLPVMVLPARFARRQEALASQRLVPPRPPEGFRRARHDEVDVSKRDCLRGHCGAQQG